MSMECVMFLFMRSEECAVIVRAVVFSVVEEVEDFGFTGRRQ